MKQSFPSIVDVNFTANMEGLLDMVEEGKVQWKVVVRKEEDSKSNTVYNRMSRHELLAGFLCGLLPFVLLLPIKLWIATLFPLLYIRKMLYIICN